VQALETIPGEESAAALRAALGTLRGALLVGAVNSVGARRDVQAVAQLQELAARAEPSVAEARAARVGPHRQRSGRGVLGRPRREDARSLATHPGRGGVAGAPMPVPAAGANEQAQAMYTTLSQPGQAAGIRRAAAEVSSGSKRTARPPCWPGWPTPTRTAAASPPDTSPACPTSNSTS